MCRWIRELEPAMLLRASMFDLHSDILLPAGETSTCLLFTYGPGLSPLPVPSLMSAFEELGICPEIIQAVEEDDWLLPTPVQQEAIPLILGGGDVLVAAETGSGKTGAFGLPCLQIVHETLRGKCSTRKAAASNLKCELNLNDKDMFVLVTEDGLECKSEDDKRWNGTLPQLSLLSKHPSGTRKIRATIEVMQGCYMFEVEVVEGLVRIGWSAGFAKLEIGIDDKSFGFGSTGKKSWNRKFEDRTSSARDYGEAFEEGDIIGLLLTNGSGCLLDREKQTISFCKNGRDLGVAYKLPPDMQRIGLKPHICGKGFMAAARFDGPMEYPVEGYTPVGEIDPTHTPQGTSQAKGKRPPLCMILEPTRDLAEQTYKCMTTFNKYLDNPTVRITLFVGGIDEKEQFRALEEGVDIVVGTLQKLMDYVRRGKLDVTHLKFLEIPRLNAQIKRGRRDRVQTLFFSATLHTPEVVQMIEEITSRPIWDSVPETVHHVALYIDPYQDLQWSDAEIAEQPELDGVHTKPTMSKIDRGHPDALKMSEKIKMMKPKMVVKLADAFNMSQCLVFCRTNVDCNNLEDYMNRLGGTKAWGGKMETGKENPYSCVDERRSNLESFKEGDVRFLICTDVAARGIDIAGLPFVIQTTLPDDIENYIHRIGRCGRAERMGLAISIVATEKEKDCKPWPGNTCLTIPFGPDGKLRARDDANWIIDEGGCSIWYDEPDLIKKVETRIGMPMKVMDAEDFSVARVLESPFGEAGKKRLKKEATVKEPPSRRAQMRKKEEAAVVVYGAKKGDKTIAMTAKHTSALAPVVTELASLEKEIQQIFAKVMLGAPVITLWVYRVGTERDLRSAALSDFESSPRLSVARRLLCRQATMAMTIDCGKLVSMSGCVTPPPPTMNSKLDMEEVATPKLGAGAGQMDGVMADALNSKLQQLQEQMFLKLEEARIVPGHLSGEKMNLGSDFVKVPLPAQETPAVEPMLLPPPTPHSVQRPAKDPRFRPIPDRANVVISKGPLGFAFRSVGHPFACAAACKYVKRKGGCRDGANCLLCHECFWSKTSSKDSEKRTGGGDLRGCDEIFFSMIAHLRDAKVEEAARARPVLVSTEEDLTLEFTRLLSTSTEACSLLTPLRQDLLSALASWKPFMSSNFGAATWLPSRPSRIRASGLGDATGNESGLIGSSIQLWARLQVCAEIARLQGWRQLHPLPPVPLDPLLCQDTETLNPRWQALPCWRQ
eukprot:s244_g38.t1